MSNPAARQDALPVRDRDRFATRRSGARQPTATMGTALVIAAGAVAAALRLVAPSWMPLDQDEAAIALAAWQSALSLPGGEIVGAPLAFHLNALVMWLLGGGDAQARLVSALAGVMLVFAAWSLRSWMGTAAAASSAVLFAVAPLWVYAGRHVVGGTLWALGALVILGAWLRPSRSAGLLVAAASGLVLAAGGPGLPFVLAAAIALGASLVRGRASALVGAVTRRWPEPRDRRDAGLAFGAAVLLGSTALLLRVDGVAALVEVPVQWLTALRPSSPPAWSGFVLPLLAYGPLLLTFGVAGIAIGIRRPSRLARFVALWLVVGLVLGAFAGTPALVLHVLLPLTLTAAMALGGLMEAVAARGRWSEDGVMTGIVLLVLAYALVQLAAFAGGADPSMGMAPATVAAAAAGLVALLLLVFGVLWSPAVAVRVLGLSAAIVLPMLAWSNGASLNYRASEALREAMRPRYVAPSADDVEALTAAASWAAARDPNVFDVAADPSFRPALAWPLRGREVRWAAPTGALSESVAVALQGSDAAFGAATYRGRPVTVTGEWDPSFGGWQGFVRWWLQRRPADEASTPELERADVYIIVE